MVDEFEQFWKAYPRRVKKAAARKSFAKAMKLTDIGAILEAIEQYKLYKPSYQDYAHPSTWLNGERWDDEWCSEDQELPECPIFMSLVGSYPRLGDFTGARVEFEKLRSDADLIIYAAKCVKSSCGEAYSEKYKEAVAFLPTLKRWLSERRYENYRPAWQSNIRRAAQPIVPLPKQKTSAPIDKYMTPENRKNAQEMIDRMKCAVVR